MRHLTRVKIVETDAIVSILPIQKNEGWTKDLSYLVLALAGFAALVGLLCMTGCGSTSKGGGGYLGKTSESGAVQMGTIEGNVREGATAASGARVYVLQSTLDGSGALESLLGPAVENATPEVEGSGRYAVTADALGQFKVQGSLSCTSGTHVYLYAVDPAGAQMRLLGVCPAAQQWAGAQGVTVNAASTAALPAGALERAESFQ